MLSVYPSTIFVWRPVYLTAAFSPVRWQRAQSVGTLSGNVGESRLCLLRMLCVPWHSAHEGAFVSAFASSWPCVLSRYWRAISAWQDEQSTLCVGGPDGRWCDGSTPAWHCVQASVLCIEPASSTEATQSVWPSLDDVMS